MKLTKEITLLGLLVFTLLSCGKDKLDTEELSGIWIEEEPSNIIQFAGSNHSFEFFDDNTFHLELRYWTDALTGAACSENRTDYIKGSFTLNSDELIIEGKYSDAGFQNEMANCEGAVNYNVDYPYKFKTVKLILHSDEDLEYYQICLVKQ